MSFKISRNLLWNLTHVATLTVTTLLASCSAAPPVAPIHNNQGEGDTQPSNDPPTDSPEPSTTPVVKPSTSGTTTSSSNSSSNSTPTVTPSPTPTPTPNPTPTPVTPTPVVISSAGDGRFDIGPTYKQADETKLSGSLKGSTKNFTLSGQDSSIFKGNYSRVVRVYFPPNYKSSDEMPFIIGMDGQFEGWTNTLQNTLDNLIVAKKIPAMIGIFVDNGGGDSRGSQRGLEYDTVGPNNAKFLETEIMAEVSKRYGVKFTANPEGSCLFGGSSSGVAAFTAAWFAPQRFRKVLSYSATFTAQGADASYPKGGWEYQEHIIKESEVKPIRVSLEAGQKENKFFNDTRLANENTYKEMAAKGYHVRYHYGLGAGHVDGNVMNQTMPENLIWLWRDYPRN
jgi:enterochelin esterase family protein